MEKTAKVKICQKCTRENKPRAKFCECGSEKFAPAFVKKLEKINRQFFVQVTQPLESEEDRITLYKWWPGGRTSLHINTQEQWEQIKDIIDQRLSKFLGWKTKKEILKEIEASEKEAKQSSRKLQSLSQNHPEFVRKILREIDYSKLKETDYVELGDIVSDLVGATSKIEEGFTIAFKNVIKKLPKQGKRAIEELDELLKSWSLKQITSISSLALSRMEDIKRFKERVLDDKTYEIRGDNSIHRILEKSMWIVDERYWLLHSNETLRKIVEKELAKKDKKFEKKRPDFVCGTIEKKLIIVELKRPSHTLETEDLNQLETYISIIEEHSGEEYSSFEAYLVGRKVSDDLKRRVKYRGSAFKIRTFSQLIDDTEKRYKDFIEALKAS